MLGKYDSVGNVKVIDDRTGLSRNSGNAANWFLPQQRAQYGYDALDRLTSWTQNAVAQESYGYDSIGNFVTKGGVSHTYAPSGVGSVRPHAVTATSAGDAMTYNANGNMTSRTENGVAYTQSWNQDNRLASIAATGMSMAFGYDANNTRVKTVLNGATTIYVGGLYEKNTSTGEVTKYYFFGGQRVAVRKGLTLSWLHSDHLGSASLATNTSGNAVANSSQRFTPFGSPRLNASGLDSKFTFTGQRSFMDEIGTMDYGARQYSPLLGRFLSADTVVPGVENPQAFNRYSYVLNQPLKYTDPTGHFAYLISLRSFAPFDTFGFAFKGDNRGYSTNLRDTSRIEEHLVVDTDKSKVAAVVFNNASHDTSGNVGQRPGTGGVTDIEFSQQKNRTETRFKADYHGPNGLTPQGTPDIDVFASFYIVEDRAASQLFVGGIARGDNFPSSEAFITDSAGNSVFLGIGFYDARGVGKNFGPFVALPGRDNNRDMYAFGFTIQIDSKGNFTGVWNGNKFVSVADWNKQFTSCDAHDRRSC